MEKGASLVESLRRVRSCCLDFAPPNSASGAAAMRTQESVLVQHVLQMLLGLSSTSFFWNNNERSFSMTKGLHMSHLSVSSLNSIVLRFMHAANCLQRVECFVREAASEVSGNGAKASPTFQAFANVVGLRLKFLRKTALDMELNCSGGASGTSITLLGLLSSLSSVCAGAEFLLQIVDSAVPHWSLEDEVLAAELATQILDYLFEKLNEFCLIQDGEDEQYQTLLLLFIGTLRPMIDSFDSWLYEGILSDPYNELFFSADVEITVEDSAFWEKGYIIHHKDAVKLDSFSHASSSLFTLDKGEMNGVTNTGLPFEPSSKAKLSSLKSTNPTRRKKCCPFFLQPIAQAIVSTGKSLQLLRHVQGDHSSVRGDAFRKSLLGNYECSVSSAVWVPFLTTGSLPDEGVADHLAENEKICSVQQDSISEIGCQPSLFDNFSKKLLRLLVTYSVESESSLDDSKSSYHLRIWNSTIFTSKTEESKDKIQKFRLLQEHLGVSQNLILQNSNNLEQEDVKNGLNMSDIGIFLKPQNPSYSVSAKDIQKHSGFCAYELHLSKCALLPKLDDDCLSKAIYMYERNESSKYTQNAFCNGKYMLDCNSESLATRYARGLNLDMLSTSNIKEESRLLDQLYPYPTVLPRVQETSLVSELLPFQRKNNLVSNLLDCLQNIKLKCTPLPTVLLQECLLYFIKKQVDHIGEKILSRLMNEWHLMDELAVLRATYLFGSGDLLQQFCDLLFNKLDRGEPWDDYYELNTMLQESIRSSADGMHLLSLDSLEVSVPSLSNDGKEQEGGSKPLRLLPRRHSFGIDILDFLQFSYKVSWPLELIINQAAIKKYNQVMAFLLKVKRAKLALDKARRWMWKKGANDVLVDKKHLLLQQKLTHFVHTFHQYVMDRVLYSAWTELCQGMSSASSLDEVIACHETYLESIQRQCFVAPDKLWALIAARVKTILALALDFYTIQHTLCSGGAASAIKAICQIEVDRVGRQFDECLVFLLRVLSFKLNVGHFPHLVDLVTRINYNYYYMSESGHLLTPLPENTHGKAAQMLKLGLFNKT